MVPAAVARYHLHRVNRGAVSFGFNDRVVVISGFGPGSPEDQGEVAARQPTLVASGRIKRSSSDLQGWQRIVKS